MYVAEIWRYPVKSMAGEPLEEAVVLPGGIIGDRLVQVYGAGDRLVTARTHPGLLRHRGTLDKSGEPLVDGLPWTSPEVFARVQKVVGPAAKLVRDDDPHAKFDILPLLVATDGAIAAFGRDRRRLRPNIIIGGVPGLDERNWPAGQLHIGEVIIAVDSLRGRCVVTTYDPDSLAQDAGVLQDIVRRFQGRLALNSAVLRGGPIRVGQTVKFMSRSSVSHDSAVTHLKVER
jgi:uncharacterized protein YcbX